MKIIDIKGLKKSYGDIEAVKGIDFYVEEGQVFAFLGCNGAGKSTTMDMLCTFLKPDQGEVTINGYKLQKEDQMIQKSIGVVFQESLLDDLLTVEENMILRASLYMSDKKMIKETVLKTMKDIGIDAYAKRLYGTLSGGQRRRCDIARALLHQPKILFLDEPTTGLDPQTRKEVWQTIFDLQQKNNMTIFLTTHYMEEAMNAHYVVIMDEGQIVARGTPQELRKQYTKDKLRLFPKDHQCIEKIKKTSLNYQLLDQEIVILLNHTFESLPIIQLCLDDITDFEITRGSMDDVFIEITGKELHA